VHELSLKLNRYFATPALVIVLVTGLYQVSEGNWSLGDAWISATFAILIVLGGITGGFFIPSSKKLKDLATQAVTAAAGGEIVLSDEYQRQSRLEAMMGPVAGLLLVAAVFLMVTKPGA
jgi:uncharacterized membrane protein